MTARILKQAYSLLLVAVIFSVLLISCAKQKIDHDIEVVFTSFKDIPGVTAAEIEAIEYLQKSRTSFNYSSVYGTELFYDENGKERGFTAMVCEWLSELFGIPFIPKIVEWEELIPGLEKGLIDFTGELTANYERRIKYFMTDDIAQRRIIKLHVGNERMLRDASGMRALRYAFLEGATTADIISKHELREFETFFVKDFYHAYKMLHNREVDAFFSESSTEAAFDFYGEVVAGTYFPIIYTPVSMTTQNPDFKCIISVIQKALDHGIINHLTNLYNEGYQQYLRQKLFLQLSSEERDYIRNNKVVPYAAEITNYPISFYDFRTNQWEGTAHDVIKELERLTGLIFKRQNDEKTHWPVLLKMLETGKVSMITELIPSEDRIGNFLWAGKEFFQDHFVLISKTEFHDIAINEILYVKTGLARNTAHSILFRNWFPNHRGIFEYENTSEAFDALERGEIDVVMTSEHQLLIMTNYRELVGYKANFIFDFYFDSTFGFNKNEVVLSSIVTKAMRLIDIENISGRWLRKTYDYRIRLAKERIPFMIGVAMLSVCLIFAVILFVRKRKEGRRLEKLVNMRTKELSENQEQLKILLFENELQLLKHNLMVKATKIGLWDMEIKKDDPVNPQNTFIWSDEFRKMLGFTDESDFPNILCSWSNRLHPDDKDRTLAAFAKHLTDPTGRTPYDLEYRLMKKDGEYSYYRASGETIRDNDGNAVRVAGALLDISETKKLLLDLETESSMMKTMFDSIPDLIFCKDTDSKYTRCNESLLQYFNLKEEDLIGKDDASGLGIPQKLADDYKVMDQKVMDDVKVLTYEEYVPDPDGNMRLFETNKVPLLLNNKITGIMGIAREITERKAMEEAAQSANKAKSEFLANMSHEIRTPMNAIIGMSEILEHEELSSRQMGFVKDISNSALSLLGIINDILDVSKIEAGKLELHPVDYNFNQFIDNVVSMFSLVAKRKGLDFICETLGKVPDYLYGDDIRLRQVLTNICGNAIKFTDKGHVKLLVSASDNNIVFRVEDTGTGIKKEDLPRLFKAFEQVDKTKNRKVVGTGLGLLICKSFIDMMEGSITVESEYGFGSAFTVTFPFVIGNPENIHKIDTASTGQTIFAPDAKILVTDDNEFNRRVASGLLNFMDIKAQTADSGAEAIKLVKQNDFDIIFMDHMMPEMDGIETVQEIRKLGGKYENIIIIALTANAVAGAREMFLKNRFNDFISKPIDIKKLREIIKKHLPPEKIFLESRNKGQRIQSGTEEELIRKTAITFVKENQNTSKKIIELLNSGDTKTVHRIAHTLKSSAGFLGRKDLQDAAFSLEQSLQGEPAKYTAEQLNAIEKELEKALLEYEPLLKEEESGKPNAVQIEKEKLKDLFAQLRPLLEKGDFGATSYVEKLHGIEGMEELAKRIDNYDFEGAIRVMSSLE